MALIHGSSGSVTLGDTDFQNATACVTSFTIDVTTDSLEASCMGNTYKTFLAGCNGWTATVECNAQSTGYDIATLGDSVACTFDPDDGSTVDLTGNAIVTGISGTTDVNGVATVTYTLQGTGALAEGA